MRRKASFSSAKTALVYWPNDNGTLSGRPIQYPGQKFGNAVLDAALTGTYWKDPILGVNRMVECPMLMTWYATGNNVAVEAAAPEATPPVPPAADVRIENGHIADVISRSIVWYDSHFRPTARTTH